jgi:hypothetical protein
MITNRILPVAVTIAVAMMAGMAGLSLAAAPDPGKFDYPTVARADYVFACMAANGQTSEMLRKCSCSIDVIATELPFEHYERAETIMRMQLQQGTRSAMFKNLPWMVELTDTLKGLQARSTLECF